MTGPASDCGERLNSLLAESGLEPLDAESARQFEVYLSLILRWNARTNLTSIRNEEEILSRHFVESIACARALPANIRSLLDFGSGAGFPGIPIALCRPEIGVTLAESQGKKAAFLQEAVRVLRIPATVYSGRAQGSGSRFDCVALRAVDRMAEAVAMAARLLKIGGYLALLTTGTEVAALHAAAGPGFCWDEPVALPNSAGRILSLGQRSAS